MRQKQFGLIKINVLAAENEDIWGNDDEDYDKI